MTDTLTILAPDRPITVADVMSRQIEFEWFAITPEGITFRPETPEDAWTELMRSLFNAHAATDESLARIKTRIGDACNFGESMYGERWAQVLPEVRAHFGITPKATSTLMWICRNVSPERRRVDTLTLTHLEIVAKLTPEEQEKWLSKAEQGQWTTETLKEEVKAVHGKPRVPAAAPAAVDPDEEKIEESTAIAAIATLNAFFRQQEAELGKANEWSKRQRDKYAAGMKTLAKVARRLNAKAKPIEQPEPETVEA